MFFTLSIGLKGAISAFSKYVHILYSVFRLNSLRCFGSHADSSPGWMAYLFHELFDAHGLL